MIIWRDCQRVHEHVVSWLRPKLQLSMMAQTAETSQARLHQSVKYEMTTWHIPAFMVQMYTMLCSI